MRYGVGIDVSKEKSMVAIVDETLKVVMKAKEFKHVDPELKGLEKILENLGKENVRIVMEDTGNYYLPVYVYFKEKGYYVLSENAFKMKKYLDKEIRPGKTDKKDAIGISKYVIEKWYTLRMRAEEDEIYTELKFLSRQYFNQVEIRSQEKVQFSNLCDQIFPGYYGLLTTDNFELGLEIIKEYYHPNMVKRLSKEEFLEDVYRITKELGHKKMAQTLGNNIYELAKLCIAPCSEKNLYKFAIEQICTSLEIAIQNSNNIISKMIEISSGLEELKELTSIRGIGENLAVRLIAEIGDIRKFKNAGSLIAYAGIDSPPYQSENLDVKGRGISKRGNKYLRKVGYEVVFSIKKVGKNKSDIYEYIIKKENEGKNKKAAKIAGVNKLLKKYYGIAKRIYINKELEEIA